ncbi:MAG: hypothetical protein ACLS5C_11385 [Waltera sp.]
MPDIKLRSRRLGETASQCGTGDHSIGIALTGIVGGVISATVNNCFMGRYAFPGMCFVMLWYAVGFSQILDTAKEKQKWWVGGILAPAMLCFCCNMYRRSGWNMMTDCKIRRFYRRTGHGKRCLYRPYTHTIFLNVYHPELHYYLLGYKLYSLPFVNTEALTNYSQLETYDNLWYICFQGGVPNEVEGEYRYEEAVKFIICIMIL